ncbi:MAG TPA: hypothetical protein VMU17_07475 [Elusimicrobiota bacterium]|nr:hypothetical protein [Elusimicrobiota bacterium]
MASHDRQNYVVELDGSSGKSETLRYDNRMRAYLRGHAIKWLDVKTGDPIVILETRRPQDAISSSRSSEESEGIVESVNRECQTLNLRTPQGRMEQFLNVPELHIYEHGHEIAYTDLFPGTAVTLRYGQ